MLIKVLDDNFIIRTFDPAETYWTDQIEEYRFNILNRNDPSDQKMLQNYTDENLNFNNQICISAFYYKDDILAFSTLFHREEYGNNTVRCLNRLYFDPRVRQWQRTNKKINGYDCNPRINLISPIMAEQQISYTKFDMAFISSEPWKPRWSNKIANNFSKTTDMEWHSDDKLYPVCCETAKGCWQHLIWHGHANLLNKGITKEEYDKRIENGIIR